MLKEHNNYIRARVNNQSVAILIDSGYSVSSISEEFFHRLRIPQSALKLARQTHLIAANGLPLVNIGKIDLSVNIDGLVVPYTFTVLKGLSFNIICGIDFMNDTKAVMNCSKHTLSLFNDLVISKLVSSLDRRASAVLTRALVLPPNCVVIVSVRVPRKFNAVLSIVEMLPSLANKMIAVAGAAVLPRGVP